MSDAAQAPGGAPDTAQAAPQPAPQGGFFADGMPSGETKPAAPAAPAAQAAPAPVGATLIDLPDEFKTHPSFAKLARAEGKVDVNELAKSYVHTQALLGKDKIVLPEDPEDEAAWGEVYEKLGRPAAPDKYEVKRPENMPEGMQYDEEGEKQLRSHAFANGWNQRQFSNAYEAFYKQRADQVGAWQRDLANKREEGMRAIHREFGPGANGFIQTADVAMREFGNDAVMQKLSAAGLQHDPDIIRLFGAVGKKLIGEDKLRGQGVSMAPTKQDLEAQIADFQDKHRKVLSDVYHPDYKQRRGQLQAFYDRLYAPTDGS